MNENISNCSWKNKTQKKQRKIVATCSVVDHYSLEWSVFCLPQLFSVENRFSSPCRAQDSGKSNFKLALNRIHRNRKCRRMVHSQFVEEKSSENFNFPFYLFWICAMKRNVIENALFSTFAKLWKHTAAVAAVIETKSRKLSIPKSIPGKIASHGAKNKIS